ncbi:lysylphosphatidylglycerol synthase transmembrane domain-containing protein [Lentzea sp. NPDC051208]|uniref:lysylphosphatidylglycerol synthase transmembrane domain-containing protein n=1 Tax=Lentzea sp. NPDC051208 TaxID=3154642 RepID=UPI00341A4655
MTHSRVETFPAAAGRDVVNLLLRVVAAAVVVVALVALVRQVDWHALMEVLGRTDAGWITASLVVFLLPLLGNVLSLRAAAPVSLPWRLTAVAQLAGAFGNLVTPANIGGMATNVRFLRGRGVPVADAAGVVGATQVMALLVTVAVAVPGLASSGSAADAVRSAGSMLSAPVVVGVVVVLLGVAVLLGLTSWGRRTGRMLVSACAAFRLSLASPARVFAAVAGSLLVNLGSAAALATAVRAFGGAVPFGDLVLVVALGGLLAGAVPVPGGVGVAELVLAAQLTAVGLEPPVALAAAVLYRLVTFWSRIPVGWLAFSWMRRSGHL